MLDEKKKPAKRNLNAAYVCNRSELEYFAQRNGVSMDEASVLIRLFGRRDDHLIASANPSQKTRVRTARASQAGTAKERVPGDAA